MLLLHEVHGPSLDGRLPYSQLGLQEHLVLLLHLAREVGFSRPILELELGQDLFTHFHAVFHHSGNLVKNLAFNFYCELLVLTLVNRVDFGSVSFKAFFKDDQLAIDILFDIFVVLKEPQVSLVSNGGHLLLVVVHHLLEVLFEFAVSLVKSDLDPLLER